MISFKISKNYLTNIKDNFNSIPIMTVLFVTALIISYLGIMYSYHNDLILRYGDAESHINIAKRVIDGLTPGLAQLGGIWLPLPHLLMVPFVNFDFLWKSGLAGSIVSGICFIISAIYVFKLSFLLTNNRFASYIAFIIFSINPNILYLQTTPMTEIPLITFMTLSTYYFIKFLLNENISNLLLAAAFGFCSTLSRYDGWFLVLIESFALVAFFLYKKKSWKSIESHFLIFSSLAFLGILYWFGWDWLILGDPLYFTNSMYSAKTQQMEWLARGQLPAHHNPFLAFLYYLVVFMTNAGILIAAIGIVGFFVFIKDYKNITKLLIGLVLVSPFIFNVLTLFLGQSVIFIPHLTPVGFDWRLFNARYGVIMIPAAATFIAILISQVKYSGRLLIIFLVILQMFLFGIGYSKILALQDGMEGLSSAKRPSAEQWLNKNYDGGLVLMDDYSRAISVIRSNIPMNNLIYIGNKPYWDESLKEPERYARWIVIQKDDAVWTEILKNPDQEKRLYKYFNKVYTSPDILVFKRME